MEYYQERPLGSPLRLSPLNLKGGSSKRSKIPGSGG